MTLLFPGKLALIQRVLPTYRTSFFNLLAESCQQGLSIIAGEPLDNESIATMQDLDKAEVKITRNRHFSDPSSALYLCWQEGILAWLESHNPDVLIVEANPRYLSTRLAIRWMNKRKRPVLGWGLGAPQLKGRMALLRYWNRISFLKKLDGIIAYSHRGADEYRALGLNQVSVAHNAVSRKPTKDPRVRAYPLDGIPTILFVGRIQIRKRIDILLRACASFGRDSQPRLVIVGEGPAQIQAQSLAKNFFHQAIFVGEKLGTDLEKYFAQADLFALPGTGGLAVQHAMTHGLPVIVGQGDGTQDDLVRAGNGWLVPPGDQNAFSEALRDALSDISRLRQMGAESYRIVKEEINLDMMVEAFINAVNHCEL